MWPVAVATTCSPPHPARVPQPLHQPRSCARSIPTPATSGRHSAWGWPAPAHLQQHGRWQAGPVRGQGRAASSWAVGSAALLRLCGLERGCGRGPGIHCLLSLPRREKTNRPRSEQRENGQRRSPSQHPPQPTPSWVRFGGGTGLPRRAGSSKSCAFAASAFPGRVRVGHRCGEQGGTAGQSWEQVLRSYRIYFIGNLMVLKLAASVSREGCFPVRSQQDKNPTERGQRSSGCSESRGERPDFTLAQNVTVLGELILGFQLAQCQQG